MRLQQRAWGWGRPCSGRHDQGHGRRAGGSDLGAGVGKETGILI